MRFNAGGVILIGLGALLLLQNFGLLPWGALWKFWPLILVAVGLLMLVPRKQP